MIKMNSDLETNISKKEILHFKKGALLAIVAAIITISLYYLEYIIFSDIISLISSSANFISASSIFPENILLLIYIFISISFISLIFLTLSIVNYRSGFGDLAATDKQFAHPFSFSKYVIIYYIILIAGVAYLLLYTAGIIPKLSMTILVASGFVITIILMLAMIIFLIISILAIIGFIYLVIGLYRFSEKMKQSIGEIGAILFIIPFADIVSPFLIYIAVSRAEKELNLEE